MDLGELRKRMVHEQIARRGITDPRVLDAFLKVERHRFVPDDLRDASYADSPLPIGEGQTISQPYIVALMTESLKLTGNQTVLEVGTGSGYQTAILAELSACVCSIERIAALAERARRVLQQLGYMNITIQAGDGTRGWPDEILFDAIMVTAASPHIPKPLLAQLKDNGRLVVPLESLTGQELVLFTKEGESYTRTDLCGCVFVPLIGEYGYRPKG